MHLLCLQKLECKEILVHLLWKRSEQNKRAGGHYSSICFSIEQQQFFIKFFQYTLTLYLFCYSKTNVVIFYMIFFHFV